MYRSSDDVYLWLSDFNGVSPDSLQVYQTVFTHTFPHTSRSALVRCQWNVMWVMMSITQRQPRGLSGVHWGPCFMS